MASNRNRREKQLMGREREDSDEGHKTENGK
jgi:hypothetical protein